MSAILTVPQDISRILGCAQIATLSVLSVRRPPPTVVHAPQTAPLNLSWTAVLASISNLVQQEHILKHQRMSVKHVILVVQHVKEIKTTVLDVLLTFPSYRIFVM